MSRRIGVWGIALVIFGLDRLIKIIVATHMMVGQSIAVLPPVLYLTYILNTGAAFGILQNNQMIFILVAIGLLLWVAYLTFNKRGGSSLSRVLMWGLGLLAGGAAGNLWDRVVTGQVIDYINFRVWPVFNLADSAIVVGMLLVVIEYWNKDRREQSSRKK